MEQCTWTGCLEGGLHRQLDRDGEICAILCDFHAGAAAEREALLAIAKEAQQLQLDPEDDDYNHGYFDAAREITRRIRQRGEEGK